MRIGSFVPFAILASFGLFSGCSGPGGSAAGGAPGVISIAALETPSDGSPCGQVALLSASVYEARLKGVPKDRLAARMTFQTEEARQIFGLVLEDAYSRPGIAAGSKRDAVIVAFGKSNGAKCRTEGWI